MQWMQQSKIWLNLCSLTNFLQKLSDVEQLSETRGIGLKVHTSLSITVGLPQKKAMKAPDFWVITACSWVCTTLHCITSIKRKHAKRWWRWLCSYALPIAVLGITWEDNKSSRLSRNIQRRASPYHLPDASFFTQQPSTPSLLKGSSAVHPTSIWTKKTTNIFFKRNVAETQVFNPTHNFPNTKIKAYLR